MKNISDAMQTISMSQKSIFDLFFSRFPPICCEMTFANILCWADVKHHQFCIYQDHLLVCYQRSSDNELQFFPPIGELPEMIMREPLPGLTTYRWVRLPASLCRGLARSAVVEFDRDNSDYYYKIDELVALKGKKFESKRNLVRRFADLKPTVQALKESDAAECIRLQEKWLSEQEAGRRSAEEETVAIKVAFRYFGLLPLRGVVVKIGEKLVGFAIGERLNTSMFVEHHEKAERGFRGAYEYVLHALAREIAAEATFLNRGQDLGISGLRQTKLSWRPVGMVEKFSLMVGS
ncbi:DUF2156 domain-containing protein [Bradyrhizobium sp. DOA9]|uniref:DUF2156 domain-containing protein n=1 Tax=Bradyrhizobium sp. DOA9 TaxID=1126627 RepID=UPI000469C151|nr:phosphatidylglycerol lysyltransferase domain-containing protein [Bradyrhizobium sp. DOA9]GAJ37576.1 hypothetical protein BDOA9_0201940 [Bradyrhizobium sp. DOA9]